MKGLLCGDFAFKMHDSDGLPLWLTLDLASQAHLRLNIKGYIDAARKSSWPDYQTYFHFKSSIDECSLPENEKGRMLNLARAYIWLTNSECQAIHSVVA